MRRDDPRPRTLPLSGALAAVALTAVLLMAIAALQGVPQFSDVALPRRLPPALRESAPAQTPGPPPAWERVPESPVLRTIAQLIAIVIGVAVALLLLWLLWRGVRALWARRPMNRRDGAVIAPGAPAAVAEEPVDARRIRAAAADARDAVDAHRDPGEAIVAAWVQLEEASARAGRARAVTETPGEFTARILRHRPGLDVQVETLLGLYESVRFGGSASDEAGRATARRCLAAIEEGWR